MASKLSYKLKKHFVLRLLLRRIRCRPKGGREGISNSGNGFLL